MCRVLPAKKPLPHNCVSPAPEEPHGFLSTPLDDHQRFEGGRGPMGRGGTWGTRAGGVVAQGENARWLRHLGILDGATGDESGPAAGRR